METFAQAAAGILLALILCLTLGKQEKEAAVLLTIAVCCMVGTVALRYLEPVIALMARLRESSGLDSGMLEILLKVVGIGFLAEVAGLVCADAGNGAMGKILQILAAAVILWMSIPLLERLLELVTSILGEI